MNDVTLPADQTVLDWLRYGTYVDERRRVLYVETPKCGCSSIKHLLRALAGAPPPIFNPRLEESRLEMMIHDRQQIPLPTLAAFEGDRLRQVLTGPGWFRFCVTRDPMDRFFSAWRDKVFLCEPGYERYLTAAGQRFVEFADFFRRVTDEEDPEQCNVHWRAQEALLQPDLIAYDKVYAIGELSQLHGDLAKHLQAVGETAELPPLRKINEGMALSAEGFFSPEILAGLRYFYRADYQRFGFAEPQLDFSPQRRAAEIVNAFTDGIFERNRMIAAHVNWLRAALT